MKDSSDGSASQSLFYSLNDKRNSLQQDIFLNIIYGHLMITNSPLSINNHPLKGT